MNAVAPGVIDSPMNSSHLNPEELGELADQTPVCRLGKPSEVAKAVRALAASGKLVLPGLFDIQMCIRDRYRVAVSRYDHPYV